MITGSPAASYQCLLRGHADCRVGELMALSVHPRFGYKHKDCGLPPPKGAPVTQELQFTVELLQCFPKVGRVMPT